MPETIKSVEWLFQVATSLVFLIPGYLVVCFLQTIRETKEADKFELTIQSLIFSLLIGGIWFYLTPPGHRLRLLLANPEALISKLLQRKPIFDSLIWLTGITLSVAIIMGYILKCRLYWEILRHLRFGRLNCYITTWEELSDLSIGSWVSVETKSGQNYIGIISSVTHHPYERALILRRSSTSSMELINSHGRKALDEVEYVWLSGDEVVSIGVFKKEDKTGKHK